MSQYVRKFDPLRPNLRGAKDLEHLAQMMETHLSKMSSSLRDEFTNIERSGGSVQRETTNAIAASGSSSSGGGSSVVITDYFRAGTVAVTTAGTIVLFSSDMGVAPDVFQFRCYDSNGDTIGCLISSLTSAGFTATPLEDATLEYSASKSI